MSDATLRAALHNYTCRDNSPHMYVSVSGVTTPRCEAAANSPDVRAALAAAPPAPLDDGHDHVPINIDRPTRDRLRAYLMHDAPMGMGYTAFIERALAAAPPVPHVHNDDQCEECKRLYEEGRDDGYYDGRAEGRDA